MKNIAVAFTGPSNSGKTTLIIEISKILQKNGYKVAIIKHDPKDKATFDKEGKDSYKFSSTGADVAVVSPNKTTLFKQTTSTIENIVELFGEFDYLLVEGLKTLPLPRIAIFREKIDKDYLEVTDVLAIDDTISKIDILKNYAYLDLNNYDQIIDWINENGKKLR